MIRRKQYIIPKILFLEVTLSESLLEGSDGDGSSTGSGGTSVPIPPDEGEGGDIASKDGWIYEDDNFGM